MRNLMTAIAITAGLTMAMPVLAANSDQSVHQHQFLSKRPYQQPVVAKASDEQWQAATLRFEQQEKHREVLKMHQIGRRPL